MIKNVFFGLTLLVVISCNKDDNIDPTQDNKLLKLAYNKDYQYPEGFYQETNLTGNVYYENSISIKPVNERDNIWIELNTNDKEQAKTWSNLSNEHGSSNRGIVQENQAEKYFEFVRVNALNEDDTLLSRIHRTDYFVSLHDKFTDIDTIGIYNDNFSLNEAKELIEYLWSCGTLSIYEKVVVSEISDKNFNFEHRIQSLKTVYGDFGLHDMIYVYENIFTLDKTSRTVTLRRELIKEIKGNFHEGW